MPEPRYRALLIGNAVFRRDPQGLPKLQGPRADVDALCETLADPESGMFDAKDIEALIDRPLQSLREELHRFFIEDATRDDILFLFYSGHGKLDLLSRLHLCANDTRVNALPVTALRYKEDIDALIEASPATSTVTILDCCHSGAFRGGELKVKATGSGRCVITSASANELALDALGPNGMSPFTSALVTGLRFAEAEGQLTAQNLYDYVEIELSPAGNSKPQFYFDGEGAIVLARRQTPTEVTIDQRPKQVSDQISDLLSGSVADLADRSTSQTTTDTADIDKTTAAETVAARRFRWSLPEPRTHMWHLLNEAAKSTMPDHDDDTAKATRLSSLISEAVRIDPKWSEAVLKRLGRGDTRHMAIEALVSGLAEHNADLAFNFVQKKVRPNTADCVIACLALAAATAESAVQAEGSKEMMAAKAMAEVVGSALTMPRGRQEANTLVRVLRLFAEARTAAADDRLSMAGKSALHWFALRAADEHPDFAQSLMSRLDHCIADESDLAAKEALQAEIALRLAAFDSAAALDRFTIDEHFLPQTAFQAIRPELIANGAAAMFSTDLQTAYRLFEVAERRCRSEVDRAALFDSLMVLLVSPPMSIAPYADHLVEVLERLVDQVPDAMLRRLSIVARSLAATAPQISEGLLRLDPDERRSRRALIAAARAATTEDPAAARRMAASVERMIGSVESEAEQLVDLVHLTAVLAPIDFDHALHLLRSLPPEGSWKLTVAMESAEALALSAPDRIDEFIGILGSEQDAEIMIAGAAQGIAGVDPQRAVTIALPLPNSALKGTILVRAVFALIPHALEDADELARRIESPSSHRANAMAAVAGAISSSDFDHAAAIAESIPEDSGSRIYKFTAFTAAARSAAVSMPRKAEKYLAAAEYIARSISDEDPQKCLALATVATAHAPTAPIRASHLLAEAEELALDMPQGPDGRYSLLAELMITWAGVAPGQAERIAEQLPVHWPPRDEKLQLAVGAMAAIDPRRAEALANAIGDDDVRLGVQSDLVSTMSGSSPAKAERLALSLPSGEHRTRALLVVAEALHRRRLAGRGG